MKILEMCGAVVIMGLTAMFVAITLFAIVWLVHAMIDFWR